MTKTPLIYLDHAAATPVDKRVAAAMKPYLADMFYNPSATYIPARQVAKNLSEARARIAGWCGVQSPEIIFTAGGTEANNLAIHGVMQNFPTAQLIMSAIEHPSVIEPAKAYSHKIASVTSEGLVNLERLAQLIDDRTVLVSIMAANNEIGTIQPLRKVAALIKDIRSKRRSKDHALPLYFHTDACQAAGYLDIHMNSLGVDMLTLNGGKIYGPKQSGVLGVRRGVLLQPQIVGGGQERGLRSGTENVAQIMGFAAALDLAQGRRHAESERLASLQQLFFNLLAEHIPRAVINGSRKARLPNNVHITIPGIQNERILVELDAKGILCAAGSACSAARSEASPVLAALGLDQATARSSLRFTMGKATTAKDIRTVVQVLRQLIL